MLTIFEIIGSYKNLQKMIFSTHNPKVVGSNPAQQTFSITVFRKNSKNLFLMYCLLYTTFLSDLVGSL